jgi:peptidoglycan/xylan/chitin deacetylase (PgdA/CDA1 family)
MPAVLVCCFVLGGCQTINQSMEKTNLPERTVVLTFDDGPNAHDDTTARLLDVLAKYQIRAMFALLGENAAHNPELVRRIHDEGHTIVNHGFSDKFAIRMKPDEFETNLIRGEQAIVSALGENLSPLFYRPQGGFYNKTQRQIWESRGYVLVPSNIRVYDAVKKASAKDRIIQTVLQAVDTRKGGIVLLHDARESWQLAERKLADDPGGVFNRSWIPEAVEELILKLLERGYRISVPGETWFSVSGKTLFAGA